VACEVEAIFIATCGNFGLPRNVIELASIRK